LADYLFKIANLEKKVAVRASFLACFRDSAQKRFFSEDAGMIS
jgi:hypothetical protein